MTGGGQRWMFCHMVLSWTLSSRTALYRPGTTTASRYASALKSHDEARKF